VHFVLLLSSLEITPSSPTHLQELNPYSEEGLDGKRRRRGRIMPHGSDAAEFADYKNVAFLEQFLSPAGKLLPR
jgi:ribosomal protein S18